MAADEQVVRCERADQRAHGQARQAGPDQGCDGDGVVVLVVVVEEFEYRCVFLHERCTGLPLQVKAATLTGVVREAVTDSDALLAAAAATTLGPQRPDTPTFLSRTGVAMAGLL